MISLDNLTVSYGGWTLFDNISFLINPKDRIGLVGRNGAGKTTLLRIITGEQQPTSGAVTLNGDCTIGYLPQTMRVADTTTLAEETAKAFDEVLRLEAEIASLTREIAERTDYESAGYEQLLHRLNDAQDHYHILGGDTREADIEKTLLGLGFKRTDFGRATSEFSGGWRMRIELAKLRLRRPSIFLLDEPTNHLDIESIQWLEEYLKNYNGAVLLISHDRAFLDNVTNRTVELSLGKITDYKVHLSVSSIIVQDQLFILQSVSLQFYLFRQCRLCLHLVITLLQRRQHSFYFFVHRLSYSIVALRDQRRSALVDLVNRVFCICFLFLFSASHNACEKTHCKKNAYDLVIFFHSSHPSLLI